MSNDKGTLTRTHGGHVKGWILSNLLKMCFKAIRNNEIMRYHTLYDIYLWFFHELMNEWNFIMSQHEESFIEVLFIFQGLDYNNHREYHNAWKGHESLWFYCHGRWKGCSGNWAARNQRRRALSLSLSLYWSSRFLSLCSRVLSLSLSGTYTRPSEYLTKGICLTYFISLSINTCAARPRVKWYLTSFSGGVAALRRSSETSRASVTADPYYCNWRFLPRRYGASSSASTFLLPPSPAESWNSTENNCPSNCATAKRRDRLRSGSSSLTILPCWYLPWFVSGDCTQWTSWTEEGRYLVLWILLSSRRSLNSWLSPLEFSSPVTVLPLAGDGSSASLAFPLRPSSSKSDLRRISLFGA